MADDDKKKNGDKGAGKQDGEDALADVVPEAAEAAGTESAEGESIGETAAEGAASEGAESEKAEAADGSEDPETGEPESRPAISLEALARLSKAMTGKIYLHFRDRDVVVIGDGGAAAELFDHFANQLTAGVFVPSRTSWLSSWFSYDPKELLGITWYPMDLAPERRPVIDPVVPEPA